jgi:hypothetical protein
VIKVLQARFRGGRVIAAQSDNGSLAVLIQSEEEMASHLERRRQRILIEAAQAGFPTAGTDVSATVE